MNIILKKSTVQVTSARRNFRFIVCGLVLLGGRIRQVRGFPLFLKQFKVYRGKRRKCLIFRKIKPGDEIWAKCSRITHINIWSQNGIQQRPCSFKRLFFAFSKQTETKLNGAGASFFFLLELRACNVPHIVDKINLQGENRGCKTTVYTSILDRFYFGLCAV